MKAARCPILAIVTAYDVDGRVATVTSFNDATARDAVNTVNQIAWAYDDWGNVAQSWQAHDGLVDNDGLDDNDTPSVQYSYDSLARLETVTYPDDSRVVRYDYGTAGEMNDRLSRVEAITNGADTETYAEYSYLGAGTIVTVEHPDVSGGLTLDYGADGSAGWDEFGRVTNQTWDNELTGEDHVTFDDFAYTYDRASNRLTRDVIPAGATDLDEKYTYDGLNRLTNTDRGTLSGGDITAPTFEQDWTLDGVGNWTTFNDNGTSQTRTHNAANEITNIPGASPTTNTAHDAAGNMVRPMQGDDLTKHFHVKYDAWNRMTEISDNGEVLIATYDFDGLRRRIVETIADGDIVRVSYYNEAWQVLEVREGGDTDNPLKQFIWDQRYVDSPIVRFHDAGTDGTIDDTLYYLTDANMNVTALVDADTGEVLERYAYDPYGKVTILDDDWAIDDGVSDVDNRVMYAGYHHDAETGLYQVRNRMYHPTLVLCYL